MIRRRFVLDGTLAADTPLAMARALRIVADRIEQGMDDGFQEDAEATFSYRLLAVDARPSFYTCDGDFDPEAAGRMIRRFVDSPKEG